MVTTHNKELLERMRVLCLHGISKDAWNRYTDRGKWYYEVVECGFKYNLSDLQSAVGIHQLRKQEQFIERRAEIARQYSEAFAQLPELTPAPAGRDPRHCWHLYVLRLNLEKLEISRDAFIDALRENGIGSSVHFIPIPLHAAYRGWSGMPRNHCPNALNLYDRIISLPLYPAMTDEQVQRVIATVTATARRRSRNRLATFVHERRP